MKLRLSVGVGNGSKVNCSKVNYSKVNCSFPFNVHYLNIFRTSLLILLMHEVVTVDGILLTKSGTMTGGISGGMEARSNRWDSGKIEGSRLIQKEKGKQN